MARWGRSQPSHTIRPHVPLIPHALVSPSPLAGALRTTVIPVEPKTTILAVEPVTIVKEMNG